MSGDERGPSGGQEQGDKGGTAPEGGLGLLFLAAAAALGLILTGVGVVAYLAMRH
jgi:hypothetical protein